MFMFLQMVHKWSPCHRELLFRSHVDKTIILLKIGERFVPIVETAVVVFEDGKSGNNGGTRDPGEKNKTSSDTEDEGGSSNISGGESSQVKSA